MGTDARRGGKIPNPSLICILWGIGAFASGVGVGGVGTTAGRDLNEGREGESLTVWGRRWIVKGCGLL